MYSQRYVWINSLADVYAFANIHTITYFREYLCFECRIRPYSAKHGSPKKTACKCFLCLHICSALCVCLNLSGVRAASGLRFMWFFHSGCFSWWRFLYILAHHHTGNKMPTLSISSENQVKWACSHIRDAITLEWESTRSAHIYLNYVKAVNYRKLSSVRPLWWKSSSHLSILLIYLPCTHIHPEMLRHKEFIWAQS